jgi:hypothetical protein
MGEGMWRPDNARAAYWFARAVRNGHQTSQAYLERALQNVTRRRLRAAIEVRPDPDPTAPVSRQMVSGEVAYVLAREGDWTEVYFKDNHTLGYVRTGELGR